MASVSAAARDHENRRAFRRLAPTHRRIVKHFYEAMSKGRGVIQIKI